MADTGWVIAGAGATIDTGATAWTNPGNITADDGTNATSSAAFKETDTLKASSFGLSVPTGATINGVETRAQLRRNGGSSLTYSYVNIGKDDSTLGTSKAPGDTIATSATNYDDGTSSDLWGLTLSASDVNASTFQVRVRINGSASVECDAIWVKVHYTSSTTLTVGQGTFTLSGQTVSLLRNKALAAGQGSFTLSGQPVGLLQQSDLNADYGAFNLSGQDVDMHRLLTLDAQYGPFTLSGQDVSLLKRNILNAEHGSFSLSGQSVGLNLRFSVQAAQGAFVLNGQGVQLLIIRGVGDRAYGYIF